MMKKLTFLNPSRENLNLFILAGIVLFGLGILDIVLNSLFEINITSFLPRWLNYFTSSCRTCHFLTCYGVVL